MTDMFLGLASFAFFCLIGASVFTMIVTYKFNELCERALWQEEEDDERAVSNSDGWVEVTIPWDDGSKTVERYRKSDILKVFLAQSGETVICVRYIDKKGNKRKYYRFIVEESYETICARLEKKEQ